MSLLLRIAFRNLFRNKRRNLATGLAIAAGYTGLLLLGGYVLRVEKYLKINSIYLNRSGHVSIYKDGGLDRLLTQPNTYSLTRDEQRRITETLAPFSAQIEHVGHYLTGIGMATNGNQTAPFLATGVEPETERWTHEHPLVRRWTPEIAAPKKGRGLWTYSGQMDDMVGLTPGLAEAIGRTQTYDETAKDAASENGADLQLVARSYSGDFSAVDARTVNHFTTGLALTENAGLLAPLHLLQTLYGTDSISYVAIFLHPNVAISAFATRAEASLRASGLNVRVYPFDDEHIGLFYSGTMSFLYTMMGFFIFLVFAVVALSIVNLTTMGIVERSREIGSLRALGFSARFCVALFACEAMYLGIIGIVAGGVGAQVIAAVVNALNIRFNPPGIAGDMQFVLTPELWFCLVLFVPIFLLSGLSAYFTTRIKVRENITNLLNETAS